MKQAVIRDRVVLDWLSAGWVIDRAWASLESLRRHQNTILAGVDQRLR